MRARVLVCCFLAMACTDGNQDAAVGVAAEKVDLLLDNGRIYTLNQEEPWAEAVAISDGKIVYAGTAAGAEAFRRGATRVVDLGGRLVLPGLQDAHIHPIMSAIEVMACDLGGLEDTAAYRAAVSGCDEARPDSEWITGSGWSMAAFGPGARADKGILDELVPERPVMLTSADGHTAWVNSMALDIAGIDADTPDPEGGVIDRDPETGEPVGSLHETAIDLVGRHVPETTPEERRAALEFSRDMLHEYGVTGLQTGYSNPADFPIIKTLDAAGELNLRYAANFRWDAGSDLTQIEQFLEWRAAHSDGHLRASGVKIFQDGVMENYTAAMLEPYLTEEGGSGISMLDPKWLDEIVTNLDQAGLQVHIHAIGDAAIRQSLDAFEAARKANGEKDLRHNIAHLQVIHPDDIPRFAELAVVANFQPLWAYADAYILELTLPFVTGEVANWMYPVKSVIDSGGTVAFGSDWSVSTANPFPIIETAITRIDAEGHDTEVMNPEQRISLEQALEAYTINAAFVNHFDDVSGSIETGKYADLIVLDQDLFEIEPQAISDTKVLLTLFEGKPVHGSFENL